jgi:hypothetical protein
MPVLRGAGEKLWLAIIIFLVIIDLWLFVFAWLYRFGLQFLVFFGLVGLFNSFIVFAAR